MNPMKANELRTGNWIIGDVGIPYKLELSDFADWYYDHNSHEFGEHIFPIPLTEEWLLKFGFRLSVGAAWYNDKFNDSYFKENFRLNKWDDGRLFLWDYKFPNEIKYVHQLQNLYFALTGEELIINEL